MAALFYYFLQSTYWLGCLPWPRPAPFFSRIPSLSGTKEAAQAANSLSLNFAGNLNIYNNKINFSSIGMDGIYQAKKEDLLYYKRIFEETMFNDNFLKIFNLKKLEKFILEIS